MATKRFSEVKQVQDWLRSLPADAPPSCPHLDAMHLWRYLIPTPAWELFPGSLALARQAEDLDNRCPTPEEWSASRKERMQRVQDWLRKMWAQSDAPPPLGNPSDSYLAQLRAEVARRDERDAKIHLALGFCNPNREHVYMARRSRRAMRRRAMWGIAPYGDVTGRYFEFDPNLAPFEYMHARGLADSD